jgi:hypothetical protein
MTHGSRRCLRTGANRLYLGDRVVSRAGVAHQQQGGRDQGEAGQHRHHRMRKHVRERRTGGSLGRPEQRGPATSGGKSTPVRIAINAPMPIAQAFAIH